MLVVVVEDPLKGYGGGIGQAVDEPVDRDPYVLSLSADEAFCVDDVLRDRPIVVVDSGEQLRDLERVGPTAPSPPSERRITTVRPKRMSDLKLSRGKHQGTPGAPWPAWSRSAVINGGGVTRDDVERADDMFS